VSTSSVGGIPWSLKTFNGLILFSIYLEIVLVTLIIN